MFKTIKGKLIFVVIFSVICIIITSILVMYKRIDIKYDNSEETSKTEETKANESTNEKGIDLKGKYNQNDLKIVEKRVTKERVEITYFQIDGLKDQKIQDKINKEILEIMKNDKKNSFGKINLILPIDFGKVEVIDNIDEDEILNIIKGANHA